MGRMKPDEEISKFLISSPCRFVGEFETDDFLLTHAWTHFSEVHKKTGNGIKQPRYAFVVSLRTEAEEKKPGMVFHNLSSFGPSLCSLLSILFGKRFDFHGMTETGGLFLAPEFNLLQLSENTVLPTNSSQKRKAFATPLVLNQFERLYPMIINDSIEDRIRQVCLSSCKFYYLALINIDSDPEVAYLH